MKAAPRALTERRSVEQAMAETGTASPSAALRKLNEGRHGRSRFIYMPHVGAKERAKAAKRLANQKLG